MSSSDNIYVNVSVDNAIYNRTFEDNYLIANFDQTSSYPIVNKPDDYYLSIIRFSLPTDNIPIFFFPLDIYQTNPNVSNLVIGVQDPGGTTYPQNVIFVPQDLTRSPPQIVVLPPSPPYYSINDTIDPYYEIFNIQPFLNMVNTAIAASVTASGLAVTAPYYIFDPQTELLSVIVAQNFITAGLKLVMNTLLAKYFYGFYFDSIPVYYAHNFTNIPYGSTVGGPYRFIEEFSSVSQWFDITKVVITSSSLSNTPEYNPSVSLTSGVNSSGNQIPIITDFAVSFPSLRDYASTLVYNPTSQYRLINITATNSLSRIQFQFYWQNGKGQLIPLLISPNQSIEIKLAFVNKEIYRGGINTFK